MNQSLELIKPKWNNPSGLSKSDTIKDAFKRADSLSDPDGKSHSGMMSDRKDLRRIVLFVREYRKLQADYNQLLTKIEELKDIFDSILCLGIEGPELFPATRILSSMCKEAEKGYNLAKRHLTKDSVKEAKRCMIKDKR